MGQQHLRVAPGTAGRTSRRRRPSACVESLETRRLLSTGYALFDVGDGTTGSIIAEFDTAAPERITHSARVTGLFPNETIAAIDFRPATGELYALGIRPRSGSPGPLTGRALVIDPETGAATQPGRFPIDVFVPLNAFAYGFDFDAGTDLLRITDGSGKNFRYDPVAGTPVDANPLTGPTDEDSTLDEPGAPESVTAIAYSNNVSYAAGERTLYGIDTEGDALVRIGGPGGNPSPDGGVVTTIGPLGITLSPPAAGFDIAQDGTAYAALFEQPGAGLNRLYTVNLATGAATAVGEIGAAEDAGTMRGFAVAPDDFPPRLASDTYETLRGQTLTVPAPGVLGNDADPEGQPFTALLTADAAKGDLTFNPDGSFTYVPDPGFVGLDSFRYAATDGTSRTAEATVFLKVRSPDPVTISIGDARVAEGDDGGRRMTFVVRISDPNPDGVEFTATASDGTAVASEDFSFNGLVGTFNPRVNVTEMEVNVTVRGDTVVEGDEQFTMTLSNVRGATVVDGEAVGTIENDDEAPPAPATISIGDVTKNEGDAGDTPFTFKVTRSDGNGTSSANYATAYGTAVSGDFPAQRGTVTFGPGETEKDVTINVEGDTFKESDNTFFVNLSQPANAAIGDGQGLGTIVNDDGTTTSKPSLSIDNVTKNEGDTGDTPFTFTVTRSSGTGTSSVKYATSYGTAVAGDFPKQSGTVSFAAGQTTRQVTILIEADRFKESDNTFFVNLTQPVNATIADGQGLGTIVNDD